MVEEVQKITLTGKWVAIHDSGSNYFWFVERETDKKIHRKTGAQYLKKYIKKVFNTFEEMTEYKTWIDESIQQENDLRLKRKKFIEQHSNYDFSG